MNSNFEFIKDLPKNGVGLYVCKLCWHIQTKHKHSIKIGRNSICAGCQQIKLASNVKKGWAFKSRSGEKATYTHLCGAEKEVDIHQMSKGLVACRACDTSYVVDQAMQKGFSVVKVDEQGFHCSCKLCNNVCVLKRKSVIRKSGIKCTFCQENTWKQNCEDTEWTFVSRVDGNYGMYQHNCGSTQQVRHSHIRKSNPVCRFCFDEEKRSSASKHGWEWINKNDRKSSIYKHICGKQQVLQDVHMRNGSIKCHGCNQSWLERSSNIYIIRFFSDKQSVSFLKLGIAYDVERRIRSFKLGPDFEVSLLHVFKFKSGEESVFIEKNAHKKLRLRGVPLFDAAPYIFSGYTECYEDTPENEVLLIESINRDRKAKTPKSSRDLLLT